MASRRSDQPTSGPGAPLVTVVEVRLVGDPSRRVDLVRPIVVLRRVVVTLAVSALLAVAAIAALERQPTSRGSRAASDSAQPESLGVGLDPIAAAFRAAAARSRSRTAAAYRAAASDHR